MANLIKHPTAARLTSTDLNRIRAWALLAREQTGGDEPGWTTDDVSLLKYVEDVLIESNTAIDRKQSNI